MSFQVVITQAAKQDLSDTFEYIYNDLQSPQAALHFLDKMEKAIFSLIHRRCAATNSDSH